MVRTKTGLGTRLFAFFTGIVLGLGVLAASANAVTLNFSGVFGDFGFSDTTTLGPASGQPTGSITIDEVAVAADLAGNIDPTTGIVTNPGVVTGFSATFGSASWGPADFALGPLFLLGYTGGVLDLLLVSLPGAANFDILNIAFDPSVQVTGTFFQIDQGSTGGTATGTLVWTDAAVAVPAPGGLLVVGLGLLAIGTGHRRFAARG
jgi:hypothetical protein